MEFASISVGHDGCVKAEYRARRDADPVSRNGAEHKGAGREARPVYDHALARSPNLREEVEITDDRAARAGHDAHIGKRRHGGDDGQDDSEDETPHSNLRSPP